MMCPNVNTPEWKALVNKIGEKNAFKEFLIYGEIPNADNYDVISAEEIKQDSVSLKPGVAEVFESNPELANAVYEALGLSKKLDFYKEDTLVIDEKTYSIVEKISSKELAKRNGLTISSNIPVYIVKEFLGARKGGYDTVNNIIILSENSDKETIHHELIHSVEYNLDKNELRPLYEKVKDSITEDSFSGFVSWNFKKSISEFVADALSKKVFRDALKKEGLLEEVDDVLSVYTSEITPQQKQQAQQLYSQYLDTIFPDSKVKDIVYHGTKSNEVRKVFDKETIQKTGVGLGKGFFFSRRKDYVERDAYGFKKIGFYLLNIVNPINGNPDKFLRENDFNRVPNKNKSETKDDYLDDNGERVYTTDRNINFESDEERTKVLQQLGYDAVDFNKGEYSNEIVVFEPEQIYILGGKQDIEGFKEFVNATPVAKRDVLYSLKTKTPQEIAKSVNPDVLKLEQETKNVNFITKVVLSKLGDLASGKPLKMTPEKAFEESLKSLLNINNKINSILQTIIKSEEDFLNIKNSPLFDQVVQKFPVLKYVTGYEDLKNASLLYGEMVKDFKTYENLVLAKLLKIGVKIVNNKIESVDAQDLEEKIEDDDNDDNQPSIAKSETGEQFGGNIFEVNLKKTVTLRVKILLHTIETGEFKMGVPEYASPDDVFSDIIEIGSEMELSQYKSNKTKLNVFVDGIQQRSLYRPYLKSFVKKINEFKANKEWDKINDILTVASKSYAKETIVLYTAERIGNEIDSVSKIKVINSNTETVDEQVANDFLQRHKVSSFYIKNSTGELIPNPEKIKRLFDIIEEGKKAITPLEKEIKFKEFFHELGIDFTDNENTQIFTNLPKALGKASTGLLFEKNNLLMNIANSFEKNKNEVFKGQYGFQDEKRSMKILASLYYVLNPGRYKIVSTRTADKKQKFSYIQPNYIEQLKREFKNGDLSLLTSALGSPNKDSFWKKVSNGTYTFDIDYFSGIREQEKGKNGKVRKNLTPKEQIVSMYFKHQNNLNVATYLMFTLSDKTTTAETKISKEFFINADNKPVGLNDDYTINSNGDIEYSKKLKEKIFNNFVSPEISRILASSSKKDVNFENFDTASKLFYFMPSLNSAESLSEFRKDLYSVSIDEKDTTLEEELKKLFLKYSELVGEHILNEFQKSTEKQIDSFISTGVIKLSQNNKSNETTYKFPLFDKNYLNAFKETKAKNRNLARLMIMDLKLNYQNAQIKSIQFLKFDPYTAFKPTKDLKGVAFKDLTGLNKVALVDATWDEFSKRAAALIAPGSQGGWSWTLEDGSDYTEAAEDYLTVTASDVKVEVKNTNGDVLNESEITDAEEFVTVQEHIDYLLSEGKIDFKVWSSVYNKIKSAESREDKYYELSEFEMQLLMSPTKPVYVNYKSVGDGVYHIDYVKSSRYPLIPQQEAGSERNKLRIWMEKNKVRSVNFASAKKLGRPSKSIKLFDNDNNFIEPTQEEFNSSKQFLSRSGLRNQVEIPDQKKEISTVTQMNRTLFDNLLDVETFNFGNMQNVSGKEGKKIKERIREKLFAMKAAELLSELGNINQSHEKLYEKLKSVILSDTSGSYTENDLKSLAIDPKTKKFAIPLEYNFKVKKLQSLINSMINKNVMLKVDGSSFVQVSAVGAKYNFSSISKGLKSDIIWVDKHAEEFAKDGAKLKYLRQEDGATKAAQVIVSQYLKDNEGNTIDLSEFIKEDKFGRKILDTTNFDEKLLQLVGSRIPNQSHVSMIPIEVVGFLPRYMQNTMIVPDGITGQMGSDFDVDKLYAYTTKFKYKKKSTKERLGADENEYNELVEAAKKLAKKAGEKADKKGIYKNFNTYLSQAVKDKYGEAEVPKFKIETPTSIENVKYELNSIEDLDNFNEDQLKQLYRDMHWEVLMHSSTFPKLTKSVDMPEASSKIQERKNLLNKYNISTEKEFNLPLDYNTSVQRFIDNRSGKTGVGVFANLISAAADFQDKVFELGDPEGNTQSIKIRLSKKGSILDFTTIGQPGQSESVLKEITKDGKEVKKKAIRSISDVLNIMFTESVDNAKNQLLSAFNWDEKAMSAVGFLAMLTTYNKEAIPVDFMMNLTSQRSIIKLFESVEQKQDSFGEYDLNAITNSIIEIKKKLFANIDSLGLLNGKMSAETYFTEPDRDSILDPETLNEMWVVGKAIDAGAISEYKFKANLSKEEADKLPETKLEKMAKDFNYSSVQEMLLKYHEVQYDSLDLFQKAESCGRELNTILGAVYTYTKGIGSNVFRTKQKINQLGKLIKSDNFKDLYKIAGVVERDEAKNIKISPEGEIGASIQNSLIFAQNEIYYSLFPVSSGKQIEDLTDKLLSYQNKEKESLSKNAYEELYDSVFNGVIAFMYTSRDLGLFENAIEERNRLLIGKDSLGKRILDLTADPQYKKNGFLKNLDIKKEYNSELYTISFRSPFGEDMDESEIFSGFYELVLNENPDVQKISKDLALFPFLTGDAGYIGRYIPIDYYKTDVDFKNGFSKINDAFVTYLSNDINKNTLLTQIVQNNAEVFSKKFSFSTTFGEGGERMSPFKSSLFKVINKKSLKDVSILNFKVSDFASTDEKIDARLEKTVRKPLKIDLTEAELKDVKEKLGIDNDITFKYPQYLLITDQFINDFDDKQSKKVSYLYKRISDIVTQEGDATYERIEILGFGNISEYDFNNPDLISSLPFNNVDRDNQDAPQQNFAQDVVETNASDKAGNNPADYTNHSGGAALSDAEWDQIGREFGVVNHKHYREPLDYIDTKGQPAKGSKTVDSKKLQAAGIEPTYITQKDYDEGAKKATQAFRMMLKGDENKNVRSAYIIRNWLQVKNADAIFALGTIKFAGETWTDAKKGSVTANIPMVKGGTGYAVQMAINEGKPVYVFDGTKEGWYTYDYKVKNFVPTETPTLTKNFAGIGSRSLSTQEVIDKSLQAIRDVYEKTFKSAQPTAASGGVEISSNAKGLAGALTNPTELAKRKGNITQSYPITFRGQTYPDSEAAYQALKGVTLQGQERTVDTYKLMVEIITAKLQQHPRLVSAITQQGGSQWILSSTHQPTNKNTVWETGGKNWFIKALNEAYVNVSKPTTTTGVKTYQGKIESLQPNQIFVFGSNPQGRHGAGAAKQAKDKFGAVQFVGRGLKNQTYALVTKNLTAGFVEKETGIKYEKAGEKSLTPEQIQSNIKDLYDVATQNPDKEFVVAYSVDGKKNLNGYTDQEMANMFSAFPIPDNMVFEEGFSKLLQAESIIYKDGKNYLAVNGEIVGVQEIDEKGNTFISTNIEEITEEPEIKTTTVEYGGKTFIIEGSEEEGDLQAFYQAQGEKGKLVNDPNLLNKILTAHTAKIHPDWIVTLTNIQNQPKYLVGLEGQVISLQDTSYGKVIESKDVIQKVMSLYTDKTEIEEETSSEEPIIEKTKPTQKRINVPEGSNPNNNVIMETEDTIYLMNDGQQEAYNFIKSQVEERLKNKKEIKEEDLANTVMFTDPLTKQFNGVIPVDMWNNMIGLAGRGGVGKTTVIKAIMSAIEGQNKYSRPSIMYLAPTHTAATVLQESLGLDSEIANDGIVNTIASHTRRNSMVDGVLSLSTEPAYIQSTIFKPAFGQPDILIIDESSMIGKKDINDMILRLKQDLKNHKIKRMPIFIFMGDYRQLGPIGEQQSPDVNKGIISSTLLLDKSKTKELTQVMRSDNKSLHQIYDTVGDEIIENINNVKEGKPVKKLSFAKYDKMTNKSSENILVVKNEEGVIDDYTNYLIKNNNPYGMFWVHYNNVEHGNTKNLSEKIRKMYFKKLGLDFSTPLYRTFANQDYVIFDGKLEIPAIDYSYKPTDPKIEKILNKLKYRVDKEGFYRITQGSIKPNSRFKVLDIETKFERPNNYISEKLSRYMPSDLKLEIEHIIIYNRQNKVRQIQKILGLEVIQGKWNQSTKKMEGFQIKDIKTGNIISKFDLKYSDFLELQEELKIINQKFTMPFTPSYVGSSHTAQGNSIKNVVVGDYNIKKNLNSNVNQDDIFSSMYTSLTRTNGTLIIIKPSGADVINNQEVFAGIIDDEGNRDRVAVASSPESDLSYDEIKDEKENEPVEDESLDIFKIVAETQFNETVKTIFDQNNKSAKEILNSIYKELKDFKGSGPFAFYTNLLQLVGKTGGVSDLTILVDETIDNPGEYDLQTKTIKINPKIVFDSRVGSDGISELYDVIIHELVHHVTANVVRMDKSKLTPDQRKWVMSLENLFKFAQEKILNDPVQGPRLREAMEAVKNADGYLSAADKSMYYGLTNMDDFMSMIMSDETFRNFMNSIPYTNDKTLFERFIEIISKMLEALGLSSTEQTVTTEAVKNIVSLIGSRNASETEGSVQKSIKTKPFFENLLESNLDKFLKEYDIQKINCK